MTCSPIPNPWSPATGPSIVEILYLLIPLSIVLVFVVGAAFWWSVDNGQFDDLDAPSQRILQDDDDIGR